MAGPGNVARRPLQRIAGGAPLREQLRDDLLRRVEAGEFASSFPGEMQLQQEYGVSRQTVREALRSLRADGIVTAARGRQPQLGGQAEITQPLGVLYSLFDSVESRNMQQRSVVRSLTECQDAHVAVRLGLEESAPLVYLERIRLAEGTPLAFDRTWLPAEVARPLLAADFTHTSLYDELSVRCGVRLTSGSEQIRAYIPTVADRRHLEIDDDTAVLRVERTGQAASARVEFLPR